MRKDTHQLEINRHLLRLSHQIEFLKNTVTKNIIYANNYKNWVASLDPDKPGNLWDEMQANVEELKEFLESKQTLQ